MHSTFPCKIVLNSIERGKLLIKLISNSNIISSHQHKHHVPINTPDTVENVRELSWCTSCHLSFKQKYVSSIKTEAAQTLYFSLVCSLQF